MTSATARVAGRRAAFTVPGAVTAIALAAHLKLLPLLVAVYWIVRRDVRSLAVCGAWLVGLGVLQLVLAPDAMLSFLRLEWLSGAMDVNEVSPYRIHPLLGWPSPSCSSSSPSGTRGPGRAGRTRWCSP